MKKFSSRALKVGVYGESHTPTSGAVSDVTARVRQWPFPVSVIGGVQVRNPRPRRVKRVVPDVGEALL